MSRREKRLDRHMSWLVGLTVFAALVTWDAEKDRHRISALEHDVEKLIEFMPMVVEREAGDE